MKAILSNRIGELARAYWQPLVLAVLAFLAFTQVIAWGVAMVELNKVDQLIDRTQQMDSQASVNPNGNASTPPGQPGQPGQPGGAPSNNPTPEKKPAKNIFKKEEMQYKLTAIYLDKAVINGQPVSVGQKVGKATLKEINVFTAVIEEENGTTKTLQMFQGGGGGAPPPMMHQPRPGINRPRPNVKNKRPMPAPPMSRGRRGGPPPGFQIRGMTIDQLKNMSPEQRKNLQKSLSKEEKQNIKMQFRSSRG